MKFKITTILVLFCFGLFGQTQSCNCLKRLDQGSNSSVANQCDLVISSLTSVNANCQDLGSIDITVSQGTSPYMYNWSNGSNDGDLSNLDPDTYTVTVSDSNGCSQIDFITVGDDSEEIILIAGSTNNDCDDIAPHNGTGYANVFSGGTAPYSWIWDTSETTETISDKISGIYVVTVSDVNGCSKSVGVTIGNDNNCPIVDCPLDITISSDTTICNFPFEIQGLANRAGGTYIWEDENGNDIGSGAVNIDFNSSPIEIYFDVTITSEGTYCVTVTDQTGCTESDCVTITEDECEWFMAWVGNVESLSCEVSSTATGGIVTNGVNGVKISAYNCANDELLDIDWTANAANQDSMNNPICQYPCEMFPAHDGYAEFCICPNVDFYLEFEVSGSESTPLAYQNCAANDYNHPPLYYDSNLPTSYGSWSGLGSANCFNTTDGILETGAFMLVSCAMLNELTIDSQTVTNANCPASDGSISITASGLNTPLTYTWFVGQQGGGVGNPIAGETTNTLNGYPMGGYTVRVEDSQGCKIQEYILIDCN